ncbi:P-loop containing nucleoside triphosphate hydrolase protein [Protomyces lactucae-debilis]|uniref:p-loop containing nucleoside triphosphate hydrolase protein n=1 Tax=Protomyces lactucae-debilis TaxID=2754530 RepID=A0A1Y2FKK6_PROLT|nr:P-loop containing nucleoside triphosphate hydrolase protein [Protomyces lactucae-debilis]ORY84503.1 P-loop containing nucleoside triphosphate hydrolase protein [Protomyces lactucae-debilis]
MHLSPFEGPSYFKISASLRSAVHGQHIQSRCSYISSSSYQSTVIAPSRRLQPWYHEDVTHRWHAASHSSDRRKQADDFFSKGVPTFAYGAKARRHMPQEEGPEVAFLGRSNVGKSSLLNRLMGSHVVKTSSKAGQTQQLNAFTVGQAPRRLTLVDTPGYGYKSHATQGQNIMDYLRKRRTLVRAFLLVEASHGIKQSDMDLADVDKLKDREAFESLAKWLQSKLEKEAPVYGEIIGTSSSSHTKAITSLRCSILTGCNMLG